MTEKDRKDFLMLSASVNALVNFIYLKFPDFMIEHTIFVKQYELNHVEIEKGVDSKEYNECLLDAEHAINISKNDDLERSINFIKDGLARKRKDFMDKVKGEKK